jgi:cytochrome c2
MEHMRNRILLALAVAGLAAAPALSQDDLAAEGEQVFKRCAACHQVGPEAKNRVGPELNGIIGRTAGTLESFSYSKAMVEAGAGGLVWNEETLDGYLADPKGMVKGTKMAFAGLKSEEDRQAVIAYLAAQGGSS